MTKKKDYIRLLAMGDFHCGHELGLTPPKHDPGPRLTPQKHRMRREIWNWFEDNTKELKPDVIIFNGDAIDGLGQSSNSSELIYTDRNDQVKMATDILLGIGGTPEIYMSYGTAYHTGKGEDWEDIIADNVKAVKIGSEDDIDIRGTVFNYKHHLGRSGAPTGRTAAVLKDTLWNQIWATRGEYPRADVVLRSHVHYHQYAGDSDTLSLTLPALQGYGTKFGGRRMSGTVDVGFVVFDIYAKGDYDWKAHIWRARLKKPLVAG